MKTAIGFLLLALANVDAFSVVKPATSKFMTQRPTIIGRTRLFAENDVSTPVLEKTSDKPSSEMKSASVDVYQKEEQQEELSESKKLMQQVKDAGTAGVISYALWELGFWAISVPVVLFGYVSLTGHFPDLSNKEDMAKLGAEAFAFVNFARFAVPLRIGLALSTTPWIQKNIVDRFFSKQDDKKEEGEESFQ